MIRLLPLLTLGCSLVLPGLASRAPAPEHPNLLIISTDEMRWNVMGCAGNRVVRTPNLDRLAAGATRYATAYCVAPICMPSRRSLFTSRYAHVHGVTDNSKQCLANDGEVDLPTLLKHDGYTTGMAGKLHFAPEGPDWSFDFFWTYGKEGPGKLESYPRYVTRKHGPGALRPVPGSQPYPNDPLGKDLGKLGFPKEDSQPWWITDRSIEFLRARKGSGKPFFFFASYKEPHSPYLLTEPYASMYDPAKMVPPPIPAAVARERREALAQGILGPSRHLVDDPEMVKRLLAAYYGHMASVDDNVGRLLGELDRLGMRRNTIVVFTADHGNMTGDLGQWFKGVMYEGSSRIPLMIRAPTDSRFAATFNRGRVVNEIVENTDVLPTVLELAALPIPKGVQGKSLAPLTAGRAPGWKNRAFAARSTMMVRDGRYKLIRDPRQARRGGAGQELYDLQQDPKELKNLAADPAHAARVKQLDAQLDAWLKDRPAPIQVEGLKPPPHLFMTPEARAKYLANKRGDE